MNFNKVSEGLIDTIEKLSQAATTPKGVAGARSAWKAYEKAIDPKGVGAPAAVPAVNQKIKPLETPAAPKVAPTTGAPVAFGLGKPMTQAGAKYLKGKPQERKSYLKQVSTQALPKPK